MTGTSKKNGDLGTCGTCGKRIYASRQIAKRAMQRLYPEDRQSVYRCGDFYHFGHLPGVVRAGREARAVVRERRRSS